MKKLLAVLLLISGTAIAGKNVDPVVSSYNERHHQLHSSRLVVAQKMKQNYQRKLVSGLKTTAKKHKGYSGEGIK